MSKKDVKKEKGTRSRKDEDKARRREDILDAAEGVIFEQGFNKVSMDHIAKAVSLSRGLLYVYFEDRDDIYRAIMARASAELHRRFMDAYELGGDGLRRIKCIGKAYYAFFQEKPDYFNMLTDAGPYLNSIPGKPSEKEKKTLKMLATAYSDCMMIMVKTLAEGVEDGSVCKERASNPIKAAYYLRGLLHGVMMSAHTDRNFIAKHCNFTIDELIDYCFDNATIALSAKH